MLYPDEQCLGGFVSAESRVSFVTMPLHGRSLPRLFDFLGASKGRLGDRELWLMGPDGEQARRLYEGGQDAIRCLYFFPSGQRVSYVTRNESGQYSLSRDLKGGPVTTLVQPSRMKEMGDSAWLPDGRLIYSD